MRKVVLYIAMSLDGFIADETGGIDWLSVEGSETSSYDSFIQHVDTILMGWNTYHQITSELSPNEWVYPNQKTYVITHRNEKSTGNITFYNGDIKKLLSSLQKEEGKDIWVCGGANVVKQMMEMNAIDRYHITLIPVLLGKGIRLFSTKEKQLLLSLVETKTYGSIVDVIYEKKKESF